MCIYIYIYIERERYTSRGGHRSLGGRMTIFQSMLYVSLTRLNLVEADRTSRLDVCFSLSTS